MNTVKLAIALVLATLSHSATAIEKTADGYLRYVFYYDVNKPVNQYQHELAQYRKLIQYDVVLDVQHQTLDNLVLLVTEDAMQHPSQIANNGLLIADDVIEAN